MINLKDALLVFTDVDGKEQRNVCLSGEMNLDPFSVVAKSPDSVDLSPGNYHLEVVYVDPQDGDFNCEWFLAEVLGVAKSGEGFAIEGKARID